MMLDQGGVCAICEMPETRVLFGKTVSLAVDHCHRSGIVRQLLCTRCNLLLGNVDDDQALLEAAANYLVKHGATETFTRVA